MIIWTRPRLLITRSVIYRFLTTASQSTNGLDQHERLVEPIPGDEIRKRVDHVESPTDSRISKAAIIGLPNAGKSVLTNALIDAPVSAVSGKVHTTRRTTRGACLLDERTQLVVADTPGVVTSTKAKRHQLEDSLLNDPDGALLGADTALVVLDAADRWTRDRLDPRIQYLLYRHRKRITSALVMTKVDVVKDKSILLKLATKLTCGTIGGVALPAREVNSLLIRGGEKIKNEPRRETKADSETTGNHRSTSDDGQNESSTNEPLSPTDAILHDQWKTARWDLLDKMDALKWPQVQESMLRKCFQSEVGWPLFDRLFMVSGLNGDGIEEIKEYLHERARTGRWRFAPSVLTDQDPETMVKDVVRANLMDRLKDHIPYTLDYKVCVWEVNENDVLCIRMDVQCRQERDAKFIIGPKGQTVSEAAQEITQVLRNLFQREVFFRLGVVTVKKKK